MEKVFEGTTMIQSTTKGKCLREAGVDQNKGICLAHNPRGQEGTLCGLHDR